MRVYIAGPMKIGGFESNIRKALDVAVILLANNIYPYIPHQNYLLQIVYPQSYETLLTWDLDFIRVFDALFRISGESLGADREVAHAKRLGIPVFTDLNALIQWKNGSQETMRELAPNVP